MDKIQLEKIIDTEIQMLDLMVKNSMPKREIDKELITIGKNILLYSRRYDDREKLLKYRDKLYDLMGIDKTHKEFHGY